MLTHRSTSGGGVQAELVRVLRLGGFTVNGREIFAPCPQCGDEKHFSLNADKWVFHCYKCGLGGGMRREVVDAGLTHILREVSKPDPHVAPASGKGWPLQPVVGLAGGDNGTIHGKCLRRLRQKAYDYLSGRGVSGLEMETYRASVWKFKPFVYFPVWGDKGVPSFYFARRMGAGDPKSDHPPLSVPLFGRHVRRCNDWVILVEGPFDHFATPQSYAVSGSSVNQTQIDQLKEDQISRVFVVFDCGAGEQTRRSAMKLRRSGIDAFPVYLKGEGDPDSMGRTTMASISSQLGAVRGRPRGLEFRV